MVTEPLVASEAGEPARFGSTTPSQDITWEEGLLPEEASTHVTSVYPNWKERRLWRHYRY
jgi:hypothetical protein